MRKVHKTPTRRIEEKWVWVFYTILLVMLHYNQAEMPSSGRLETQLMTFDRLLQQSLMTRLASKRHSPSILAVQSMAVKKVQLVLFQRSIRMPGNKLMRSWNGEKFLLAREAVESKCNLQPIKCEQFLLVFWDVTSHSGAQHPKRVELARVVRDSWDASPKKSTCPAVTREGLLRLPRPCCQRYRSRASLLDSRPAPNRVFRPVGGLFRPYHKYQRLIGFGAAAAFPHCQPPQTNSGNPPFASTADLVSLSLPFSRVPTTQQLSAKNDTLWAFLLHFTSIRQINIINMSSGFEFMFFRAHDLIIHLRFVKGTSAELTQ